MMLFDKGGVSQFEEGVEKKVRKMMVIQVLRQFEVECM